MTPTKKTFDEGEYDQYSSDLCPHCFKRICIMAAGFDVSVAYECPHCEERVFHPMVRRRADQRVRDWLLKLAADVRGLVEYTHELTPPGGGGLDPRRPPWENGG